MAPFQRLTREDLTTHTRDELLLRLEAEQEYWPRKEKRGLPAADQHARNEFSDVLIAVINPAELLDSMTKTAAWFIGERPTDSTYFTEKSVHDR